MVTVRSEGCHNNDGKGDHGNGGDEGQTVMVRNKRGCGDGRDKGKPL